MDPSVSVLTGFECTTLLFKYLDYFLESVSCLRPPPPGALHLLVLFTRVNDRIMKYLVNSQPCKWHAGGELIGLTECDNQMAVKALTRASLEIR